MRNLDEFHAIGYMPQQRTLQNGRPRFDDASGPPRQSAILQSGDHHPQPRMMMFNNIYDQNLLMLWPPSDEQHLMRVGRRECVSCLFNDPSYPSSLTNLSLSLSWPHHHQMMHYLPRQYIYNRAYPPSLPRQCIYNRSYPPPPPLRMFSGEDEIFAPPGGSWNIYPKFVAKEINLTPKSSGIGPNYYNGVPIYEKEEEYCSCDLTLGRGSNGKGKEPINVSSMVGYSNTVVVPPSFFSLQLPSGDGGLGFTDDNINDINNVSGKNKRKRQHTHRKTSVYSFPTNVKNLLSTGIFEGVPVKYVSWSRGAVNAYEFEKHAGCDTKHPNNNIYFPSGKSLYSLVQELKTQSAMLQSGDHHPQPRMMMFNNIYDKNLLTLRPPSDEQHLMRVGRREFVSCLFNHPSYPSLTNLSLWPHPRKDHHQMMHYLPRQYIYNRAYPPSLSRQYIYKRSYPPPPPLSMFSGEDEIFAPPGGSWNIYPKFVAKEINLTPQSSGIGPYYNGVPIYEKGEEYCSCALTLGRGSNGKGKEPINVSSMVGSSNNVVVPPSFFSLQLPSGDGGLGFTDDNINDIDNNVPGKNKRKRQYTHRKMSVYSFPTNVKNLLSTGIFEGVPVKYVSWSRGAVNAYEFEKHAGCDTKHPNNNIYFPSGKSLYSVVQELKLIRDFVRENSLEEIIIPTPLFVPIVSYRGIMFFLRHLYIGVPSNLSRSPPPPHAISSQPVASATHMIGSPPVAFVFASASCLGSRSVDGQYRSRKIEE
nr:uncharacterized protein LOC109187050 [Ipomoea batatas]